MLGQVGASEGALAPKCLCLQNLLDRKEKMKTKEKENELGGESRTIHPNAEGRGQPLLLTPAREQALILSV